MTQSALPSSEPPAVIPNRLVNSNHSFKTKIRQLKIVVFVAEFREVIGDLIIFYCPRPGLQSTNPNASVSRKLAIAISIIAPIGY
jgi:hypothetical protein